MPEIATTPASLKKIYASLEKNLAAVRKRLGRPLTLAEKILYGHLDDPKNQDLVPWKSYLLLRPDRVAMQDATAQMALLQFMSTGKKQVAVPTTVHCDHLILAKSGAVKDMEAAINANKEVYDFLRTVSAKYGIGFWKPGAGIIHQVILEQYAVPGTMMIGTDSHTPNAGGLGMFAVGVGGADAVDVMTGFPWEVLCPKILGVKLTGELSGWAAPKDVILKLCGILSCDGGTNRVIEYFGPGARSISATGKATITNMGAELGATCSIFPFDERMDRYMRATNRERLADLAAKHRPLLAADSEVEKAPERFFERVVEIDLSTLEPHVVGPHTPDLARPVSKLAGDARTKKYPERLSTALIGSCTNSSYEDISRVADVARQAARHGAKAKVRLLVSPGSEQIYRTIQRDDQMAALQKAGATVLANACGPCIGQWKRDDVAEGQANSILTSFNRNFPKRNDGLASTHAFIASPEVVMAYSLVGTLAKNPLTDAIEGENGKTFRLTPPGPAPEIPPNGFEEDPEGFLAPPRDAEGVQVLVSPTSERLQLLAPFAPWDGKDFTDCALLIKAQGKCTTDHISQAGPWLKFRGHLDKISDNLLLGAVNAFTGKAGEVLNALTGKRETPAAAARAYKAKGLKWIVVGDTNYGEGSSREHAAMEPRHLGGCAVIVRSFARIHETNLKKQGLLPLTFAETADYDKIQETDTISLMGLAELAPGKPIAATIRHADGKTEKIQLRHTFNADQVKWFRAGSALNTLKGRS